MKADVALRFESEISVDSRSCVDENTGVLLQWLCILRFSNCCRTQMQMDEVAVTFITLPPTNQNVEFSHKACVFLSIEASRSGTRLLRLARSHSR